MTSSEIARGDVEPPRPPAASGASASSVARQPIRPPASSVSRQTIKPPAPSRPPLAGKPPAPVLEHKSPPFVVRLSQFFWIVSFALGAVGVVYTFVIRQAQLPDIAALIRGVDGSRVDETYTTAADIVYWVAFGGLIVVLLLQITMLVSFSNRRPKARWWQFGTILLQGAVVLVARELVAIGERGTPLAQMLLIQFGLAVVALLCSLLPWALRWTARKHDIRHGDPTAIGGSEL